MVPIKVIDALRKILSKWHLIENLKKDKFFGKIALLFIFAFPVASLIWLLLVPSELKIKFLSNYYAVSIISLFFAFVLNVFIVYSATFNLSAQIIVLLYSIFFAMSQTVAIAPPILSIATQIILSLPMVLNLQRSNSFRKYFFPLAIISLTIAQFPPFPIIVGKNLLWFNVGIKLVLCFVVFYFFSFLRLNKTLLNFLPFIVLSVNFIYSCTLDFPRYYENFKIFSASVWNVLTIPFLLLLAGDLVDEVGRLGNFASRYILFFVNSKRKVVAEICFVLLIASLLTILWFFSPEFIQNFAQKVKLPVFISNYKEAILISLRVIAPILLLVGLIAFFYLKRIETIELKNRFNQVVFAIIVFSVQIVYSYFFTEETEISASLAGFPFALFALGLFWEPLKLVGTIEVEEEKLSVLLAFILILSGLLVDINLVFEPYSIARVSIVYQILGGVALGIPILFFRLLVGWDYDEKFFFRNFFLGFVFSLFPVVIFPNQFWMTNPIGLALALIVFKVVHKARISFWDYLSLGFGVLSQSFVVWIIPLPIIAFLNFWFANLGQIVPIEIFSEQYFKHNIFFLLSAFLYLALSRTKLRTTLSIFIALVLYFFLNFIFLR